MNLPYSAAAFFSKLRAPHRGTSLGPLVCGANNLIHSRSGCARAPLCLLISVPSFQNEFLNKPASPALFLPCTLRLQAVSPREILRMQTGQ
jgi:hypothetical protein